MYYAHIRWDDRGAAIASQTVAEHLSGTAALSRAFAEAFGAGDDGELIGLLHDLGKCTDGFQNRLLRDGPRVDHATAGAVEWTKMSGSGNTGWKVTVGDTGWRNISALIGNGWTGQAWVRRVGDVVDLRVETLNAAAATAGVYLALPAGFRTTGSLFVRSIFYTTAMTLRRVSTSADSTVVGYVAGDVLHGSLAASTAEPWPTTLPGTGV